MALGDQAMAGAFLAAIVDDDLPQVRRLLKADSGLAKHRIAEARLYDSGIVHWIYAGDTALHLAAAGHRVEIVQFLLAAGADPESAANHRCGRPLHYAADGCITSPAWAPKRQVETIRALLAAGADINAQDKNGATPLHRAVRTRCAAAVKHLLAAGGDPARKNKSGSSPFHLAVQNTGRGGSGQEAAIEAQHQIIKTLLASRASTRIRDGKGKSVFDCAQSSWIRDLLTGPPA